MKRNEVISILMKRDGMTEEEAKNHLQLVREAVHDAVNAGNYDDAEEIVYSELGLEMDYIFDIMGV